MKILCGWNLFLVGILTAMIVYAPTAFADDISPDADVPDISTLTDSKPDSQVLEIPQQCDQNSVAIPCDRYLSDSPSSLKRLLAVRSCTQQRASVWPAPGLTNANQSISLHGISRSLPVVCREALFDVSLGGIRQRIPAANVDLDLASNPIPAIVRLSGRRTK